MSTMREDFAAYRDPSGLLSGVRNPTETSGNAAIFTAEEIIVLARRGGITAGDIVRVTQGVADQCEIPGSHGLYRRSAAYPNDADAHDNYTGLATIALYLGTEYARLIWDWGREHHFHPSVLGRRLPWPKFPGYFRNEEPRDVDTDPGAWIWRNRAHLSHVKLCANVPLSAFDRACWAYAVGTAGLSGPGPREEGGQDAWRLSFVLVASAGRRFGRLSGIMAVAADRFRHELSRVWGAVDYPMSAVYAQYFQTTDHPLSRWAVNP